MRLRWKLLLVLLAISIIPLFALSLTTRQTAHEMVEELTARSRKVLINRARTDLLRRMEDHARLVSKERQIVALALRTQSGRLRQILDGSSKRIGPLREGNLTKSEKHVLLRQDGSTIPLLIDKERLRIDLTPDASIDKPHAREIFKPMLRPFRKLEQSNPDLIYWQIIRLTNGAIATYPYYEAPDAVRTHAAWSTATPRSMEKLSTRRMLPMMSNKGPLGSPEGPPVMRNTPPQLWYDVAEHSPQAVFWTPPSATRLPTVSSWRLSPASRNSEESTMVRSWSWSPWATS